MIYLKPDEMDDWAVRARANESEKPVFAAVCTEMIDAHLKRSLVYRQYSEVLKLGAGRGAYLNYTPVISLDAVSYRRYGRRPGGSWAVGESPWVTLDPDDVALNETNWKIELAQVATSDGYGRIARYQSGMERWEIDVTYTSGYLADTMASVAADVGATTVEVDSGAHFEPGMKITTGLYTDLYTIASVTERSITIEGSDGFVNAIVVGDDISELVPNRVKAAAGMLLEDRLTYLPGALRQLRKLDVISDSIRRAHTLPMPPDAAQMLAPYTKLSI